MEEIGCSRCGRGRNEVKLLDAISDAELVKICEECALMEGIPIIRKPSSEQLAASEKTTPVRQRMLRMAGLPAEPSSEVKKVMNKLANPTIDSLRKKDYKSILDEKYQAARKRNQPINLVDNYNWFIAMERKKRKIDRNQLAKAIGVNETAIKMLELKQLPDDALSIIARIEQHLGLKLRVQNEDESRVQSFMKQLSTRTIQQSQQPPVQQPKSAEQKTPARILKFDPETSKNLTIYDLQKMKQAKELAEDGKEKEEILGKEIEFSEEDSN